MSMNEASLEIPVSLARLHHPSTLRNACWGFRLRRAGCLERADLLQGSAFVVLKASK
jgi:hypothetical protein